MATQDDTLSGQIQQARKSGYSDDEITSYLGKNHADLAPKIKQATDSGYKSAEILQYLGGEKSGNESSQSAKLDQAAGLPPGQGLSGGESNAYSDSSAIERVKGGVKAAARSAVNAGNVLALGIPKSMAPKQFADFEKRTTPNNEQQSEGAKIEGAGELLAPIPGLSKIKAAKSAGLGAKALYAAAHGAIDTGIRAAAETGDVKDAAAGATIGAAMGPLTTLLDPIAGFLSKNARSQYAKVIHPSGMAAKELVDSKLLSGKGDDLVGKGVYGLSKESLVGKINKNLSKSSDELKAAWSSLPAGTQMKADPIARQMVDWIKKEAILPNGQVGRADLLHEGSKRVVDFLTKVAPNLADADPHDVRAFRQMLDKEVHNAGLPINGRSTAFEIKEKLADTIRAELNRQFPSIGKVNQKVSFWKSAATMMQRSIKNDVGKKEWHEGIGGLLAKGGAAATLGGAIGYSEGHDRDSALGGAAAGAALAAATRSTAWRTVSPIMKDRISKLIVDGKAKYAADLATRAVGLSIVRTTKPYSSYADPPSVQTSTPPSKTEAADKSLPPK